jgi:ubiquinone/menaquinone biosynthesis C-methylase UbiE
MSENESKLCICEICGGSHPTEEHLRFQEEAVKAQWDKRYREERRYREEPAVDPVPEFFEKYKEELKGGKILDLGCGNGRNLRYIARQGFEIYGIDISEEALVQLRETLEQEKLSANIQRGSFYNLPYENKTFDCVISISVLQHNDWKGAKKAFSEISRVLKDGGLFLLRVRSTNRSLPEKRRDIRDHGITYIPATGRKAGIMLHNYSREEIEELAYDNSLEIIDIKEGMKEGKKEGTNEKEKKGHWIVVFRKKIS